MQKLKAANWGTVARVLKAVGDEHVVAIVKSGTEKNGYLVFSDLAELAGHVAPANKADKK